MKVNDVFDIYQNCALGSILLREFTLAYEKSNKETTSPSFERLLPILPILFTKELVTATKNRSKNVKGLYNVIADNRIVFETIPSKTSAMFEKTMFSLLLGVQANFLEIDFENNLVSTNVSIPQPTFSIQAPEIGEMIRAARKFGSWFSNLSDVEFLTYINLNLI